MKKPLEEATKKILQDGETINNLDSFEIFDYIMLGQLQSLYIDFWKDLFPGLLSYFAENSLGGRRSVS